MTVQKSTAGVGDLSQPSAESDSESAHRGGRSWIRVRGITEGQRCLMMPTEGAAKAAHGGMGNMVTAVARS